MNPYTWQAANDAEFARELLYERMGRFGVEEPPTEQRKYATAEECLASHDMQDDLTRPRGWAFALWYPQVCSRCGLESREAKSVLCDQVFAKMAAEFVRRFEVWVSIGCPI